MSVAVASWIWGIVALYLGMGVLFSLPFMLLRLKKSDPDAAHATWGFKLIVLPGVILLWPALARRWIAGIDAPQEERSPHR